MTEALVPAAAAPAIATGGGGEVVLPQVIVDAGPQATARFLEFFAGRIANARTRAAYGRAVGQFSGVVRGARPPAARHLPAPCGRLHPDPPRVGPHGEAAPGRDPHARRLARRQPGPPLNPAAAVRGPKHVVTKGATPVLSPAEARKLLETIDTSALAGLRDRALLSVMLYSFARVSAVLGMRRQDYFGQDSRGWLRLYEKGGRRHDVPAHHRAAAALDAYVEAAGLEAAGEALFQSVDPTGGEADRSAVDAAAGPGHDQAARGGGGAPGLDVLPHIPGDGDRVTPTKAVHFTESNHFHRPAGREFREFTRGLPAVQAEAGKAQADPACRTTPIETTSRHREPKSTTNQGGYGMTKRRDGV